MESICTHCANKPCTCDPVGHEYGLLYEGGYIAGYLQALLDYAWWKDGVQYVGSGVKTLDNAREDARKNYIDDLADKGKLPHIRFSDEQTR